MNIKQLELKRLRELLGAIRRSRHLAQAMRTPVARLVRFDRATASGINRVLAKWEPMGIREPIGEFERTFGDEPIERLATHTKELAGLEKKIQERIARVTKDPLLHASASELKKLRKRKSSRRAQAETRLEAMSLRRFAELDKEAAEAFRFLEVDAQEHPRARPEDWALHLKALKQAYRQRNWIEFHSRLRLIASIGRPIDLEILNKLYSRGRDIERRGNQ